jgi:hypothetical protein
MTTESMCMKIIPALIYKNEENEYKIDIYEFCEVRDVQVRDLYPKLNPIARLINNELISDEIRTRYISSIHVQPKSHIIQHSTEIKIVNQPSKQIIYKNSILINVRNKLYLTHLFLLIHLSTILQRAYQAEKLPFVKVLTTREDKTKFLWKSTLAIDLEYE